MVSAGGSQSRTYTPLSEVERTLYGATSATTWFTSIDAEATQQFRNGISAGPLLTVTRTSDRGKQMRATRIVIAHRLTAARWYKAEPTRN